MLIGILKVNNEKEDYLNSLDPNKRHPLLPRVGSNSHLLIEPIFRCALDKKPTKAIIISGYTSFEFVVCVHAGDTQLILIEGDINNKFPQDSLKYFRTCECKAYARE